MHLTRITSDSPGFTETLGRAIGHAAPGGAVIAFRGDLGAGKTTLSRGIAEGLGIEEIVSSPSFTIVSEYQGRLRLFHIDLWRLRSPEDFEEIGGFELYSGPQCLTLVEWSERLGEALPAGCVTLDMTMLADGSRSLEARGAWLEAVFQDFGGRT
jgi:tRNA threonylcarbamoyladenosine biosynthesis protein TsaE